jgi:tetratricopeptide (TPR) repeat protein
MKAKRYLLTLAVVAILQGTNAMAQDFTKGLLYFNDGNFVLAKKYLLKELSGTNKDQAYYLLGKSYQNQGIKDSSAIYYQKGLEVNPENAFAYVGLGEVALSNNDKKTAEANFKKAKSISSEKKNPALWMAIYAAYMNQATPDVEEANDYINKAKSLNKNFAGIYITEGDILLNQKKIGEAATKYETALYYDKTSKDAFLKLGRIYVKSGNYQQSLDAFNNLYQLDSTYFPVHKERGEVYYAQGKFADAAKSYAKFFAASEPSYNDLVRYALILFFNKDYNKSLEIVKQAQAINPTSPVANRVLAYNFFETKDYANGAKVMEQFMANAKPDDILQSDYEYYARLLSGIGNDSLAVTYFEKATTPKNKIAMAREIQNSYEKMKKYDKVVELYEQLYGSKATVGSQTYFDWAKASYYAGTIMPQLDSLAKTTFLHKADSLFGIFTDKQPELYFGFLYRARVNATLDPDNTKGLAKPYYEKLAAILEPKGELKFDPAKVEKKKELTEAYLYLGYQYYLQNDAVNAKATYTKVLLLDPTNEQAKSALKGLK